MSLWRRIESPPAPGSRSSLLAIGLMCLVAFAWAWIEWLGSLVGAGYSPYQVVWTRYGTHLLLMLVILGPRERGRLIRTSRPFLQIFRALLMLAMPFCFIAAAQRQLAMGLLWSTTWTSVPMMLVFAIFLLGEKVTRSQWVAVVAGLLGAWLVLGPSRPRPGLALGLAAGVAGSFALYAVLTRLMRTERTETNLFHTALWVFIPLTMVMPRVWHTPSPKVAVIMAGIGVLGFVLLLLLDRAMAHAPAALVAPFLYTACLWDAALSAFGHRSVPGPAVFTGAGLIVGSCAWVLVREYRAAASSVG